MDSSEEQFCITSFFSFREVPGQYSDVFIKNRLCVKVSETEDEVQVCTAAEDKDCLRILASYHYPKRVVYHQTSQEDFVQFIGTILEKSSGDEPEESKNVFTPYSNDLSVTDVDISESAVNIVNGICISALRDKASDIHIHRIGNTVDVRFRLNGVLKSVQSFNSSIYETLVSRIKIMASLNTAERRLPQDGRISARFGEDRFDSRVSVIPTADGEAIVMRLFGSREDELSLSELGFTDNVRKVLDKVVKLRSGLVIVTGPTGSGKNTTLYALLKEMDRTALKIISIEDPVERIIEGVDQIEINEAIGLTFSDVLRRVLRQDPDVIMVGEIRDDQTAELAVRAALTGHLILTTLHTEDSISSITRLEDQGIKSYLISSVLKVCMAQRLVRRKLVNGKTGRIAVGEVFESDDKLKALISEGKSETKVRFYLKEHGFMSMKENAHLLSQQGVVTEDSLSEESLL